MKIDAWVVALDETNKYNIAEADAPFIEKIEGVYLFDRNQFTHACELAPSYNLKHLYNIITVADGTSTSKREALEDDYAYGENSDIYAHLPVIDRLIEEGDPSIVEQYDSESTLSDDEYDDHLYAICEYYVCNRPF